MARKSSAEPPYLHTVRLTNPDDADRPEYPFSLDVVKSLRTTISLAAPVTIFVGENGSGKSTLLEALAVAVGLNAEGGSRHFNFETKRTESNLHEHLRIQKGTSRPRDTYFLRAEAFYNVTSEIDRLDQEGGGGPPIAQAYGVKSLHNVSHGESFMALFLNRLCGQGLYILDEPESALSPARQITMLARMHALVQDHSQFIIATHSPLILGYPGARILELSGDQCEETAYQDTMHYRLTLRMLKNPEHLKRLVTGD